LASDGGAPESVAEVRRRWGKLYSVRTSGGRIFLVLKDAASERYLKEDAALGADDLETLAGPLARTAGMALAYRLLAVRDRTEREIRSALEKEGLVTPEVVGDVIDTLRRQGYLDDRRLASGFVRFTLEHKPSGPHFLRRKLRAAGVRDEIIEEELGDALPPERERRLALELARRKLKGAKDRAQAVRRVHGLLSRRGFSERIVNEICAGVLRGAITGEHDDEE
jgi:regulatory protein